MSQPGDKLEASIAAEIARLSGETAANPADELPPDDETTPPEGEVEEHEEPELEAEGPGEGEEEGEEEGDEDPGERVETQPETHPAGRKPGRVNRQMQELRLRAQEAERRLAEAEAQRVAIEQQRAAQAAAEQQRREEAEIAALPPEEQGGARDRLQIKRLTQSTLATQRRLDDLTDQQAFQASAAADPILRAISPRVEAIAAQYRNNGQPVNRETIANYLLGQLARSPEGRRLLMQQKPAKKQKRTPTSRGDGGGRSGASATRKSGDTSRQELMRRLRDKPI